MGRPRIIPVLIDHCEEKIPAILRPIAYIDFSSDYAAGIERLLVRGLGLGAKPTLPAESASDEAGSNRPRATTPEHSATHPVALLGIVTAVVVIVVLGTFFLGGTSTEVYPTTMIPQSSATGTSIAGQTGTRLAATPTSVPVATPVIPPPPASIENPMCPEPQYTNITFPPNRSTLSGLVQVKGSVIVHPYAQPYRYSLFYRSGIVRDEMDGVADVQAPLSPNGPNGKNFPIQVMYFQPQDGPLVDVVLGSWDTTKLASDWYSLRVWSKDRGGTFAGCDVYVYVYVK
jgi:hypothetical protein